MATANSKNVFVVYGRNKHIMREMFAFLRMLSLSPIPWEEAVLFTNRSASYIGETLDRLLQQAQAVVVLFTGDDEAQLRSEFFINADSENDRVLFPQPRPNVLFEAGFAHGIGKIPIYVAREGTTIHFDVKDYPVIQFRNMKELKDGITRRLIALSKQRRIQSN